MADKFPGRGDFSLPSSLFDEHEWMVDEFIDGETGQVCTINYPPKPSQCDNCVTDPSTGRSSGIYNGTGPISFSNHTVCPRCGGEGKYELPNTDDVRLRVYWDTRSWIDIGVSLKAPDMSCMTIGYMEDLPKIEKMTSILVQQGIQGIRRYEMQRTGEAAPWGFRHNRYFVQYLERSGAGG
jgi:hypothetical protein